MFKNMWERLIQRVTDFVEADQLRREKDAWVNSAVEYAKNADFYRGLLERVGRALKDPDLFISDDGSVQDSMLMLKIPEAVERLMSTDRTSYDREG